MSDTSLEAVPAGRPIRLVPTAPGFWMTTLGVSIAALAPLLGFLVGVMSRRPDGDVTFDPIYWGLFAGVLVGALGVLMAVVGGLRLWRHLQRAKETEPEPAEEAL